MLTNALVLLLAALTMNSIALASPLGEDTPFAAPELSDRSPSIDPFHCLVPDPSLEPHRQEPKVKPADPPPPAPVPVQVEMSAYAAENDDRLAILRYNGTDVIVEAGWESEDGAFVVKRVSRSADGEVEVEIFDKLVKKPRTLRYGSK